MGFGYLICDTNSNLIARATTKIKHRSINFLEELLQRVFKRSSILAIKESSLNRISVRSFAMDYYSATAAYKVSIYGNKPIDSLVGLNQQMGTINIQECSIPQEILHAIEYDKSSSLESKTRWK
ncbi:hypothetical protein QJS04_geneDACA000725 [Acorus gramineus]|uniref:Uncharacterized protein n=1 Tax=Acorus gramineus TaxID=55184 RepID=A0AAV9AP96_ACOGR|nr:hypothetical protein QJS04_geneDACA000725 [Acorus gramineus]